MVTISTFELRAKGYVPVALSSTEIDPSEEVIDWASDRKAMLMDIVENSPIGRLSGTYNSRIYFGLFSKITTFEDSNQVYYLPKHLAVEFKLRFGGC